MADIYGREFESKADRTSWSQELKAEAISRVVEAGGDAEAFRDFMTEGAASLIIQFDYLAEQWAKRFPRLGSQTYGQALTQYGFANAADAQAVMNRGGLRTEDENLVTVAQNVLEAEQDFNERGFRRGVDGSLQHKNGTIVAVDPATGNESVIFNPRNQKNVEGSRGWINHAREEWDQARVTKWRRKLAGLGYSVDEAGKWGADLEDNLKAYWRNFYLTGGKEMPMDGRSGEGALATPREAYDPIERRADAAGLWKELTGFEAGDHEVERLDKFARDAIAAALKNGATPEHARLKGQEALADAVEADPGVKELTTRRDEDEEGVEFFTQAFQALRSLA